MQLRTNVNTMCNQSICATLCCFLQLDDDLRGNESSEEVVMLKNRLHSMDEMLEKMNAELMKHQEEKVQMLTEIDQLKQLQVRGL